MIGQSELFPNVGRVRTDDPSTSHAGAAKVDADEGPLGTVRAGSDLAAVLDVFYAFADDSFTPDEAAQSAAVYLDVPRSFVRVETLRKRVSDLHRTGLVHSTGRRPSKLPESSPLPRETLQITDLGSWAAGLLAGGARSVVIRGRGYPAGDR